MGKREVSTMSELAEKHGVAPSTVTRWKKLGLLVFEGSKVLVEPTERKLRARGVGSYRVLDEPATNGTSGTNGRGSVPVDPDDPSTWTSSEAARQKQIEMARKHALERRRREGELVDAEEVRRDQMETARRVREAFLSWPGRIAPEIAADLDLDPGVVGTTLERYVRKLLKRIADELRAGSE